MKINKHLVLAMCGIFVGSVTFASNGYELTPINSARRNGSYHAISQRETISHTDTENSTSITRCDRNCVDVFAVTFALATVAGLGCYAMMRPTLEESVQPQRAMIQYTCTNADSHDMTITCPNHIFGTELKPRETKVIACPSRSNQWSSLTATSLWGEWYAVKTGSPTIRTDAHTNHYIITRNKCQRRCVHYHQHCSGSGKSRVCTLWPHFMEDALSFTPVSVVNEVNNTLPSFNGADSGYISDIAPGNLRIKK